MSADRDRGTISVAMLLLLVVVFAGAGLVTDGGRTMAARRHALIEGRDIDLGTVVLAAVNTREGRSGIPQKEPLNPDQKKRIASTSSTIDFSLSMVFARCCWCQYYTPLVSPNHRRWHYTNLQPLTF